MFLKICMQKILLGGLLLISLNMQAASIPTVKLGYNTGLDLGSLDLALARQVQARQAQEKAALIKALQAHEAVQKRLARFRDAGFGGLRLDLGLVGSSALDSPVPARTDLTKRRFSAITAVQLEVIMERASNRALPSDPVVSTGGTGDSLRAHVRGALVGIKKVAAARRLMASIAYGQSRAESLPAINAGSLENM